MKATFLILIFVVIQYGSTKECPSVPGCTEKTQNFTVYRDAYYRGPEWTGELTSCICDCVNLPGYMDNEPSSIRFGDTNTCLRLYELPGCKGDYHVVKSQKESCAGNFVPCGFNDIISSVSYCYEDLKAYEDDKEDDTQDISHEDEKKDDTQNISSSTTTGIPALT